MIDRVKYKDTEISRLGLGTMRLPCKTLLKREANPMIDYDKSQELVDMAYSNGVNYFDTAYMYHAGKSEKFIGHALSKYPRDTYYLADKLPIWMCRRPDDMERIFQKQLDRTGTDHFDFYLLHSLDGKNFKKCEEYGAYDFLLKKREAGLITNIGFSFHGSVDDMRTIIAAHEWDFAQIQMNYLDWKNQDAETLYKLLTDADIPIIVMEPVRGGKLADVPEEAAAIMRQNDPDATIASWAIKFVASHSNVMTILSGMNSVQQMQDNLNSLTDFVPFDDTKLNVCANVASIINKKDIIPCTGCDYCADCLKGVRISSIFAVYNKVKTGDISHDAGREEYAGIDVRADSCVNCKSCESHCPQGIKISDWMNGGIPSFFI